MNVLGTILLAFLFKIVCGWIEWAIGNMRSRNAIIYQFGWDFIIVPIMAIKWFPLFLLFFWLAYVVNNLFASGGRSPVDLSSFQREYGHYGNVAAVILFIAFVISLAVYLFQHLFN